MPKIVEDKKKVKTIRLTDELKIVLKEMASKHRTTQQEIIENGINLYILKLEGGEQIEN